MDAAKIMWVMYEHPETHFEELALRFMDIRKRIYKFPKMGVKAKMVAITTTSVPVLKLRRSPLLPMMQPVRNTRWQTMP